MLIETLTDEEARVLGTLAEKSLATPEYYPLTLNSLRNACNQKSSREPVTEYGDDTVAQALAGLKRKCLVTFIPYGSGGQHKFRHFLEDPRFNLHKPDIAVLAVLLLRGGQTLNEIKLRTATLHGFANLEETEAVLERLASQPEPLTELLPKRPGWKEPRWRDRICPRAEILHSEAVQIDPVAHASQGGPDSIPEESEIVSLRRELAELRSEFAELKAVVDKIRSELY